MRLLPVLLLALPLVGCAPPHHQGGGVSDSEVAIAESGTESIARIPELIWPLGRAEWDGIFLQLGPDTDPAAGTWQDWECHAQFTYDGHRGTDVMAYNFRIMDQGVPVLAAADGLVTWTQTGNFDRNYWTPYIGLPNGINIRHNDGSNSQYFHLRTHSVSVVPGDRVEAGQVIGYVGSSGSSPNPHLHFELWENGISRDPNQGSCNSRLSLWKEPIVHPATRELSILDWDVFLDTDLSGSENNNYIGDKRLKNRPFRPLEVARSEPELGIWVQLQGMIGATYQVRILDPTGAEFDVLNKGVIFARSVQWHALYTGWEERVSAMESPEGVWTVELLQDGAPVRSKTFTVGDNTVFPLRFFPLAGRSIKLDGGVKRDTLRVRHSVGTVAYELVDAPAGVSLVDNHVLIDPSAAFPTRNAEFQVIASDEAGRTDTMYYHVVSPGKPLGGTSVSRQAPEVPPARLQLETFPNPSAGWLSLAADLPSAGPVMITVYDLLGRSRLQIDLGQRSAGTHSGRLDLRGLSAGVYQVSLEAGGVAESRSVVLRPGF
ncbi:MAG: peptidoglycan DD-metalloendopeptidase family protein [Rhodothermales bacterium]|nr:peptidoglycan DD-metalloendopeptidase family protein [Rhodothermales bacterium]MBO6779023.1 peptidoglycan DD-metalloendopeptidase family protein [Rhodothermales bacterium]